MANNKKYKLEFDVRGDDKLAQALRKIEQTLKNLPTEKLTELVGLTSLFSEVSGKTKTIRFNVSHGGVNEALAKFKLLFLEIQRYEQLMKTGEFSAFTSGKNDVVKYINSRYKERSEEADKYLRRYQHEMANNRSNRKEHNRIVNQSDKQKRERDAEVLRMAGKPVPASSGSYGKELTVLPQIAAPLSDFEQSAYLAQSRKRSKQTIKEAEEIVSNYSNYMKIPAKFRVDKVNNLLGKFNGIGYNSPMLDQLYAQTLKIAEQAKSFQHSKVAKRDILQPFLDALSDIPRALAHELRRVRAAKIKEITDTMSINERNIVNRHMPTVKEQSEMSKYDLGMRLSSAETKRKQLLKDINQTKSSISSMGTVEDDLYLKRLKNQAEIYKGLLKEIAIIKASIALKEKNMKAEAEANKANTNSKKKQSDNVKRIEQTEKEILKTEVNNEVVAGKRMRASLAHFKMMQLLKAIKQNILAIENATTDEEREALQLALKQKDTEMIKLKALMQNKNALTLSGSESLRNTLKEYLSMEKVISRMSFVWTAMFSYGVMNYVQGIFNEAINGAKDLEQAITRINSIMTVWQQQYSKAIEESIIRNSALYGEEIKSLGEAAREMISSNISPSAVPELLGISSKMAAAGLTDTANSTNALISVMNSYQLSVSQATDASDLFFQIVKYGRTTIEELNKNFGVVASTAALLGIAIEDVGASLAVMTNAGIDTDQAITALNQLMLNFTKGGSKEAREIAHKYGIELNANAIKQEGMIGLMKKLDKATDNEIVALAGSTRAFKALASAINQSSEYTEFHTGMVNRYGSTELAFQEIQKNTIFQMKQTRKEMMLLGLDMAREMLPTLQMFTKALGDVGTEAGRLNARFALSLTSGLVWAAMIHLIIKKVKDYQIAIKEAEGLTLTFGQSLKAIAKSSAIFLAITIGMSALSYIWNSVVNKQMELNKVIKELGVNSETTNKNIQESSKIYQTQVVSYNRLTKAIKEYKYSFDNSKSEKERIANFKTLKQYLGELKSQYPAYFNNLNIEKLTIDNLSTSWGLYEKAILNTNIAIDKNLDYRKKSIALNIYDANYTELMIKQNENNEKILNKVNNYISSIQNDKTMAPSIQYDIVSILSKPDLNENDLTYIDTQYYGYQPGQVKAFSELRNLMKNRDKIRNEMSKIDNKAKEVMNSMSGMIDLSGNKGIGTSTSGKGDKSKSFDSEYRNELDYFKSNFNMNERFEMIKKLKEFGDKEWLRKAKEFKEQGMSDKEVSAEKEIFIRSQNEVIYNAIKQSVSNSIKLLQKDFKTATTTSEQQAVVDKMVSLKKLFSEMASQYENDSDFQEYVEQMFGITVDGMQTTIDKFKEYARTMSAGDEGINIVKEYIKALVGKGVEELSYDELTKLINDKTIHPDVVKVMQVYQSVYDKVAEEVNERIERINRSYIERRRAGQYRTADMLSVILGVPNKYETDNQRDVYREKKRSLSEDMNLSPQTRTSLMKDINDYEFNENQKNSEALKNSTIDTIDTMKSLWDTYYNYQKEQIQKHYENLSKKIDDKAKYEYRSQMWVDQQKDRLRKKQEREEKRMGRVQKRIAEAQAIINTALAVTKIGTAYVPPTSWILQGMEVIRGALQLAIIQKQKFGKGGKIFGPSHTNGGVDIEAEGGEFMFSRKATEGNEKFLYAMQYALQNGRKPVQSNDSPLMNKLDKLIKTVNDSATIIEINAKTLTELDFYKKTKKGERQHRGM